MSLYLFNLSASFLFSSIHRCKSSSFSLQAWDNSSFSLFCSTRRTVSSLDWVSIVNSNSDRVAFKALLLLARVRASWRYWDTLKQPGDEVVVYSLDFEMLDNRSQVHPPVLQNIKWLKYSEWSTPFPFTSIYFWCDKTQMANLKIGRKSAKLEGGFKLFYSIFLFNLMIFGNFCKKNKK